MLQYAAFRVAETLLGCLPARHCDAIGRGCGSLLHRLARQRRHIVARNIRIAWGAQLDPLAADDLCREVFRHCGANLVGGMRCAQMSDAALRRHVKIENADVLSHGLKQGKGAIVALAHMGNWEVLARLAPLVIPGARSGAIYRPLGNARLDALIKRRREQSGTVLLARERVFHQSAQLLREGGVLGILADQHAGKTGARAAFFGKITSCSPLPLLLHQRTGAPIFFASVRRDAPAHWVVRLQAHDPGPVSTASIMGGVQAALALSAADGFWLHDRWKIHRRSPLAIRQDRGDSAVGDGFSERIVLQLSADPALHAAAQPAVNALIRSRPDCRFIVLSPQAQPAELRGLASLQWRESNPADLLSNLAALDAVLAEPLDLLLVLDPAIPGSHRQIEHCVPHSVGFQSEHSAWRLALPLPPTALTEPSTWDRHFFQRLGSTAAPTTSNPTDQT